MNYTTKNKLTHYKLAVIGSRTITDEELIKKEIKIVLNKYNIIHFYSGGALGVDTIAEKIITKYNIPTTIFKPNWTKYGRSAGLIRNQEIINKCDICLAFWDGQSKGTKYSIEIARKNKKKLFIVNTAKS